jgi:hypothetical protein
VYELENTASNETNLFSAELLGHTAVNLGVGLGDAVVQDYELEGADRVQFAPGQSSKYVTLKVLSNPRRTTAYTLTLGLTNPPSATLGEPKSLVFTLAPTNPTDPTTTPTVSPIDPITHPQRVYLPLANT